MFVFFHDLIYSITPEYRKLHENIAGFVNEFGNNLNILEVPATTGNLANLLQYGHNVTTIDISMESLQAALKKNPEVKTGIFDANKNIPFPDSSFNGIVSTNLLYFLKNKTILMNEYYRVLKENGFLIVTEFEYKSISDTIKLSSTKVLVWKVADVMFCKINNISKSQYLTLDSIRELLIKHNFIILKNYKTFTGLSNTVIAQKR